MKVLLICFATLLSLYGYAQNNKVYKRDSAIINASLYRTIMLSHSGDRMDTLHHLPFGNFVFKDVRSDTSHIGVKIVNSILTGNTSYRKLVLQPGTASGLQNYFNSYGSSTSNATELVCFIKQLRLTEIDTVSKTIDDKKGVYYRLRITIEGFLQTKENYFPALRIDTVVTSSALKNKDYSILYELLDQIAIKATKINVEQCLKKKAYILEEIETRYAKQLDKPIITAQVLSKGVYKSFKEFQNNQPSITEYEFIRDKKTTILYTRDNSGKWLPERSVYGFCDGTIIWLKVESTFRPLVRRGKTFEFISQDLISLTKQNLAGPAVAPSSSPVATLAASLLATAISDAIDTPTDKIVYQVDMETGQYY